MGLVFFLAVGSSAGAAAQVVERGPYLQLGTPDSVVVRWRTDVATDSEVRYGITQGNLNQAASDPALVTEHEIVLTGLSVDTTYYYSVGTTSQVLAGDDPDHFFLTSPLSGTWKPTRIWVLGDSGTADSSAAAVRDAYYNHTGSTHTDIWLMLGDNAYPDGTDTEYEAAVFDMYPEMLRKSVLWPTLGNHDGNSADSDTQTGVYYDIFTLPTQAEAGGVASGTEAYYSFDYANIHFICLESHETDRDVTAPMMTWLAQDVASTVQDWVVAFWHNPPYSKGSHDSDTGSHETDMRENALPILEDVGVDLVLTGHSHSYERSYLLDGHYGLSSTLTAEMILDGGDGRTDGTGAYEKPSLGPAPHQGAVYCVAGSSGFTTGGDLDHPAMFISLNVLGSVVLDVDGPEMDVQFLDSTGAVQDYYTIIKGSGVPPAAPSGLSAATVSGSALDLSWTDNSINETGFEVERSLDELAWAQVGTAGPGAESYSDTGLTPDTTYFYRVRATNDWGDSAWSNTASATTGPVAPGGLTATAVSQSQIDLAWTDSSTNETGFKVERSPDGVTWSGIPIALLGADTNAYSDTGLAAGTPYWYRVRATNAVGDSDPSNTATDTTHEGLPAAPTDLAAVTVSDTRIDLTWTDNSANETGFEIERSLDEVAWSTIATVGADVTAHADTGLAPQTTYYYRARATNAVGGSAWSNTASATTGILPAPPTDLSATAIWDDRIDLVWTDNSTDETGFEIERSLDEVTWSQIATVGADVTSYGDTGLTPATAYSYRVRATGLYGASAWSNTASATTPIIALAESDLPVAGSVSGTYLDTHGTEDVYESITERESGGKPDRRHSFLEHKWTFTVTPGDIVTFTLEAYRTDGGEGDDFVFAYSSDDSTYTDMLTVDKPADDDTPQMALLPPNSLDGTLYVRVVDSDRSQGNKVLDTVLVDRMYIRIEGGDSTPPAAPANLSATAFDHRRIDLDWADSPEQDLAHYNVYRDTNPGGPYTLVASEVGSSSYSDTGLSPSTTYYYVVTAVDMSLNESGYSNEASATTLGCVAQTMHVASILPDVENLGKGSKRARVMVTIVDECGVPVQGALVTGTFTGDFNETSGATTDGNGVATIYSAAKKGSASYTFCVDDVTGGSLTYEPLDNIETCDSSS